MSDFLTSEISTEKKAEKKIADSVGGFQILSTKGADVAFQKKQENETCVFFFVRYNFHRLCTVYHWGKVLFSQISVLLGEWWSGENTFQECIGTLMLRR